MIRLFGLLVLSAAISLIAAFIILFMGKTGLRGAVIERSPVRLVSELFSCDFCLSFWTSLFIAAVLAFTLHDVSVLICAAMSAPIVRRML